MAVYIVLGRNFGRIGPVGVSKTREGAEKIAKENEYMLEEYEIIEQTLED